MARYECRENGSSKFWVVNRPVEIDGSWFVTVEFGKIGVWGQTRSHEERSRYAADRYYEKKVDEKLNKGYSLVGVPVTMAPAARVTVRPACGHNELKRNGSTFECKACKTTVEFNRPQAEVALPEFQTKVRRFFDLRAQA